MNRVGSTLVVVLASAGIVLGQAAVLPAAWIGTWQLSPKESKFGPIWAPGLPEGLTVENQSFSIEAAAGEMKVRGDTIFTDGTSTHDGFDVNLDNRETVLAPGVTIALKRTGETIIDVIGKVNTDTSNYEHVNHFVISPDGKTLTDTKTQTQREVVPEGTDQTKGAVVRTSTSVLVFKKIS